MAPSPKIDVHRADDGVWVVEIDTMPMGEDGHLADSSPNLRVWVNEALVSDGPLCADLTRGCRRSIERPRAEALAAATRKAEVADGAPRRAPGEHKGPRR
jgi:hypothetical protein